MPQVPDRSNKVECGCSEVFPADLGRCPKCGYQLYMNPGACSDRCRRCRISFDSRYAPADMCTTCLSEISLGRTRAFSRLVENIQEIRQLQRNYDIWQDAVGCILPDEDNFGEPPAGYEEAFGAHWELIQRWIIVHVVVHLDAYTEDIIRAVHAAQPNTLKSNRKLSYKEAIEHRGELVGYLGERVVANLSYKSQDEICDYMCEVFGVDIPENQKHSMTHWRAVRNCIVHNRGAVNERHATDFPNLSVGERIPYAQIAPSDAVADILRFAEAIDDQLIAKFDLTSS